MRQPIFGSSPIWEVSALGNAVRLDRFLSYEPCEAGAHIHVHAGDHDGKPASERLFGLFTEHLGKNVYGGAWAQVIANPGFELYDAVLDDVPESHRKDVAGVTDKRLRIAAAQFGMADLPNYREKGLAPYWSPAPGSLGSYALVAGFNGKAQRMAADKEGACGIETPLFLPLHRTAQYRFQAHVLAPESSALAPPERLVLQVWQVLGRENAEIPSSVDPPHMAPFGLDSGGPADGAVSERLLAETTLPLHLPHMTPGKWAKAQAVFTVSRAGTPAGARLKLRLLIPARTVLTLDQALLFPTDAIEGWDPEVVQYLRDMRLSVLRFPGGNFASAYHWQDGVGPIEWRPEKANPAWPEWEPNHVGVNEWLTLCELVGAEPMICVNAGNGSPEEAAEWVRYCNDPPSTEWGRRRAADGHPAPYNVRLWEVGNELWGDFQVGWCTAEEYGERFGAFARAMKAADPTIQLIAVGGSQPRTLVADDGAENLLGSAYARKALEQHGDQIWAIAEHAVMGGSRLKTASARDAYLALLAHTHHIGELNEQNKQAIAKLGLSTLVAQTEQMVAVRGVDRPTDDSLAAAIVWAGFMNWFLRSEGFVQLYTRSALINHGDLLGKTREVTYPMPGYHAQAMYARQPGRIPVSTHVATPVLQVNNSYFKDAELPCIDVVSLLSQDGAHLSILITNRSPEQMIPTVVQIEGFACRNTAQATLLAGPSYTSRNTWQAPDHVKPLTAWVHAKQGDFTLSLPPHSVMLLALTKA